METLRHMLRSSPSSLEAQYLCQTNIPGKREIMQGNYTHVPTSSDDADDVSNCTFIFNVIGSV
eukprot:3199697-Amphidinium_carterae.1